MKTMNRKAHIPAFVLLLSVVAFVVVDGLKITNKPVESSNDSEVIDKQSHSYDIPDDTHNPYSISVKQDVQPDISYTPVISTNLLRIISFTLKTIIVVWVILVVTTHLTSSQEPDSSPEPDEADEPDIFTPNRISYDHMQVENTESIIHLSINDDIAYGKEGDHSLALIDRYIRRLVHEPNHKKIFLYLTFEQNKNTLPCLDVSITILHALRFYKRHKKNTTIIAYSPSFEIKSYLIASHADIILTEKNAKLYLPWRFLHKVVDHIGGTKTIDDRLDETHLPDSIVIDHNGNQTVAGKYKQEMPKKDIQALIIKTVLDVFDENVKSKKNKLFSLGTLITFGMNLNAFLGGCENIFDVSYPLTYNVAHCLKLIDRKHEYSDEFLNASKISLLSYQLKDPVSQNATIDVVYIIGELSDVEEAMKFEQLFNWVTSKPFIKGILLVIDSPGGLLSYVNILTPALSSLAKQKHVVSYTQKQCCSGAYAIASYSEIIVAQQTAQVGSIGVTSSVEDTFWYSQELIRHAVSDTYETFINTVATNRYQKTGQSLADYKTALVKTQARVFPAIRAKKRGLVDYIGDMDKALTLLARTIGYSCPVFHHEPWV